MSPISRTLRDIPAGWLIPVAILFVISFPPLFGHEIVAILCGVVYGLWIGFAIVCAGTFLGEIGNFYAFRYWFKERMRRYESKSLNYACLAHIVRHGGFVVVIMARLSAIPGHFTTAVFASVGMSIWIFALAAFLTLPKQLAIVFLGALLNAEGNNDQSAGHKKTIVTDAVLAVTFIITVGAAVYLYLKMSKARPMVARERRKQEREMMKMNSGKECQVVSKGLGIVSGDEYVEEALPPRPASIQIGQNPSREELYINGEEYPYLLTSPGPMMVSPTLVPSEFSNRYSLMSVRQADLRKTVSPVPILQKHQYVSTMPTSQDRERHFKRSGTPPVPSPRLHGLPPRNPRF